MRLEPGNMKQKTVKRDDLVTIVESILIPLGFSKIVLINMYLQATVKINSLKAPA